MSIAKSGNTVATSLQLVCALRGTIKETPRLLFFYTDVFDGIAEFPNLTPPLS